MIVGIHQPEHLPWLGFFHKMYMSDIFVLLDNVQFEKNYFQNRNRIRTSGSKEGWSWVTVPVLMKGRSGQQINEVRINNRDVGWGDRCWKAIKFSYNKAKQFDKYKDFYRETYTAKEWDRLVDLNVYIIQYLKEQLGIRTKLVMASDLHASGEQSELLLNTCKELKADCYLSGVSGRDYLDEPLFRKEGIKVIYQNFNHPQYKQVYEPFIPQMSIIDLLFNYGDKSLGILREASYRSN